MNKRWLKTALIPRKTALGHIHLRMVVHEESMGFGQSYSVGVFNCTREELAIASALAKDVVCWTKIPPLMTEEVEIYWQSIASKIKAQIIELVPEAKNYVYRG